MKGDYSRKLPKYLLYLSNNGYNKAICACTTTKIGTINAVNAYHNRPIPKTIESNYSLRKIVNTNDAIYILKLPIKKIKPPFPQGAVINIQ